MEKSYLSLNIKVRKVRFDTKVYLISTLPVERFDDIDQVIVVSENDFELMGFDEESMNYIIRPFRLGFWKSPSKIGFNEEYYGMNGYFEPIHVTLINYTKINNSWLKKVYPLLDTNELKSKCARIIGDFTSRFQEEVSMSKIPRNPHYNFLISPIKRKHRSTIGVLEYWAENSFFAPRIIFHSPRWLEDKEIEEDVIVKFDSDNANYKFVNREGKVVYVCAQKETEKIRISK